MNINIHPGKSYPLGATIQPNGVNFSLFSKSCEAVELLLFDRQTPERPVHVIRLDPILNKTFYYWHVLVEGIGEGQLYGYRVYGHFNLEEGHRYDGRKVLLDPYTKAVYIDENFSRQAAVRPGDNCIHAMKSVVVNPANYDWEGDQPLHHPFSKTVIYEVHVGGFTLHPSSGLPEHLRGTYKGMIEKIPYLKELGITAVELLPVQQFDAWDLPNPNLTNYWGYSPVAFFAAHSAYGTDPKNPNAVINEFRDMVKAFHRAGIEVILDVVFNHTAENGIEGPTYCFKGLENGAYYTLSPDKANYLDYSGCGNSLNANHSIVRRLIMDCLRYWVSEMHVDGFRFDLASVLARDGRGRPLENPPILWEIESDPVLAGAKIIAEAWDAGGLYQVGSFIGHRWAEWNGKYRDDIRTFVKGDLGRVSVLKNRIEGSPDVYAGGKRDPNRSINFITCHDGFTLNDLVSYNQKHNQANGEDNRDGPNDNHSWNCGLEGPSNSKEIEELRLRQMKNFLTIMFFSHGTPMLLMGDEVRRTQKGNNNTYCQNNELSWFNWENISKEAGLHRFTKELIAHNLAHEIFQEETYWSDYDGKGVPRIMWHGIKLRQPDWSYHSNTIAFSLNHEEVGKFWHVMINAFWEPLTFEVPRLPIDWRRIIDTNLPSPHDINSLEKGSLIYGGTYTVKPRSIVVLMAHKAPEDYPFYF